MYTFFIFLYKHIYIYIYTYTHIYIYVYMYKQSDIHVYAIQHGMYMYARAGTDRNAHILCIYNQHKHQIKNASDRPLSAAHCQLHHQACAWNLASRSALVSSHLSTAIYQASMACLFHDPCHGIYI